MTTNNASNMVKSSKLHGYDNHEMLTVREPQTCDSSSELDDEDQVFSSNPDEDFYLFLQKHDSCLNILTSNHAKGFCFLYAGASRQAVILIVIMIAFNVIITTINYIMILFICNCNHACSK